MRMLRCVLLTVLGLVLATSPLLAQAPPAASAPAPAAEAPTGPEPMEEPQTGDHWTYELRDDITGDVKSTITTTVTDVSGTDISIRVGARQCQLRLSDVRSFLEYDEQRHLAIYAQ
jgi:hypothetical protein